MLIEKVDATLPRFRTRKYLVTDSPGLISRVIPEALEDVAEAPAEGSASSTSTEIPKGAARAGMNEVNCKSVKVRSAVAIQYLKWLEDCNLVNSCGDNRAVQSVAQTSEISCKNTGLAFDLGGRRKCDRDLILPVAVPRSADRACALSDCS